MLINKTQDGLNSKPFCQGYNKLIANTTWADKHDFIDEPPYLTCQAIADRQQALEGADPKVPGNYPEAPTHVQPRDSLPWYMMRKARLLGASITPWHATHSENYGGDMWAVLASMSELTSGYPPASTIYAKVSLHGCRRKLIVRK
jgi:hypothetical protein